MRIVAGFITAAFALLAIFIFGLPLMIREMAAPQQAAVAAMGVFFIFIPYAIARVLQGEAAVKKLEELIKIIKEAE